MPRYRRILVPTDFSDGVKEALSHAAELGRKYEASLVLLHVVDSRYYPSAFFPSYDYFSRMLTEFKAKAEAEMKNLSKSPRFRGVKTSTLIKEGDPSEEIVATAREQKADMVVMGTHGRTGLEHLLIGSTTEKVIRTSPCPVLTVRSKTSGPGARPRGRKKAARRPRKKSAKR
jgi:universal stress protein A